MIIIIVSNIFLLTESVTLLWDIYLTKDTGVRRQRLMCNTLIKNGLKRFLILRWVIFVAAVAVQTHCYSKLKNTREEKDDVWSRLQFRVIFEKNSVRLRSRCLGYLTVRMDIKEINNQFFPNIHNTDIYFRGDLSALMTEASKIVSYFILYV